MSFANVLAFPRPQPKVIRVRDRYLVRHEEKTDVFYAEGPGRRVINVKKTFFDGSDRLELVFEKQVVTDEDVRVFLFDVDRAVDNAVNRYFSA